MGDVHALELPDDSFDVVHAHQVLQHVADPVQAFARDAAGLQAGRDRRGARQRLRGVHLVPGGAAARRVAPAVPRRGPRNGGEPDAGRRLLAWAHEAGFADVRASASTWCFADADDRAWWCGMWADRILQSDLAGQLMRSNAPTSAVT